MIDDDCFTNTRINQSGELEYIAPPHDLVFNPNDKSPISDFVHFGSDLLCNETVFSHFSDLIAGHIKIAHIFIGGKKIHIVQAQ